MPSEIPVRWVSPGPASQPTVLAFTGFGHRLDPWMRLRPPGWRVGVLDFPIGHPPTEPWSARDLAGALVPHWGEASHRALCSFSFGAAGASAVGKVLTQVRGLPVPHFASHVAPVQWARAPWRLLRGVPTPARLKVLRGFASGSRTVRPLASKLAGPSVKQFVHVVEHYTGWDFVARYLPYIDWIDSTRSTLGQWDINPWPTLFVGGDRDRVIPNSEMAAQAAGHTRVEYASVDARHFDALDAARPLILERLARVLAGEPVLPPERERTR